jgi:hypothetical protein
MSAEDAMAQIMPEVGVEEELTEEAIEEMLRLFEEEETKVESLEDVLRLFKEGGIEGIEDEILQLFQEEPTEKPSPEVEVENNEICDENEIRDINEFIGPAVEEVLRLEAEKYNKYVTIAHIKHLIFTAKEERNDEFQSRVDSFLNKYKHKPFNLTAINAEIIEISEKWRSILIW